jgi:tyrosyl-tRNA synthetase
VRLIRKADLAPSNSEARRLIRQGAVVFDGSKITDEKEQVPVSREVLLKVGRRIAKVRPPQ